MASVVGVHGISQHHGGIHALTGPWRGSLVDGMERARGHCVERPNVRVAFYGDVLLPYLESSAGRPVRGLDLLTELDPPELEALDALSDDLEESTGRPLPTEASKGLSLWPSRIPRPLSRLAQALDARFGESAGCLMLGELKQVRRYLTDPGVTKRADDRVSAAVAPETRVLIGHSLGSVVAFEWARKNSHVRLDLLVTLGSPLGLRMVHSQLDPLALGTSAAVLPNVTRWINIYDPGDVVACACPLGERWPGVEEHPVHNGEEPHAYTRYLSTKETGLPVADALGLP
jgi:hypothetical protein